ncbi:glycosyltransferase involved in cell wall biosynthesis [Cupriavidus metallidurans]|nr:glycosyltransferase [Cupriavidus sp.]
MLLVNHVMSNNVASGIFSDIISYYRSFAPPGIEHVASASATLGGMIRHYHRPNLESRLSGPCVVTVHHDLRDDDPSLTVQHFTDRYREANRVICLNTLQRDYLAAEGITNTVVIPHGYHARYIRARGDATDIPYRENTGSGKNGRVVIGVFSRRYPRKVKGEGYIYELAQRLDPARFEFVLIGKGRTYDAAVLERFGFDVTAYETLPYKTVASAYRTVDALLMSSWFEGGPANIPEAVGGAVPVLCNPIGMAKDMVVDRENGLHLSMDAGSDAEQISAWLLDPASRADLREGAKRNAGNAITWAIHASRVVDVYREVLNETLGNILTWQNAS